MANLVKNKTRKEVISLLKSSNTFEEYFDAVTDERFTYPILEDRIYEFAQEYEYNALRDAVDVLKKKGELKKETLEELNI